MIPTFVIADYRYFFHFQSFMFESSFNMAMTGWAQSEGVDENYYECWQPLKKKFRLSWRWQTLDKGASIVFFLQFVLMSFCEPISYSLQTFCNNAHFLLFKKIYITISLRIFSLAFQINKKLSLQNFCFLFSSEEEMDTTVKFSHQSWLHIKVEIWESHKW